MQDLSTIVIACLTALYGLTLLILKYIVAQKDKQADNVGRDIKEIKDILTSMQTDVGKLNNEVTNNTNDIRRIDSKLGEINQAVYGTRVDVAQISEWKKGVDRRFDYIEKEIEQLKAK